MLVHFVNQEVREVLEGVPYADNEVWLHTDASLMPRARAAWASWNFLGRFAVSIVTYLSQCH